jgi:type VI protein secretion system component VasK
MRLKSKILKIGGPALVVVGLLGWYVGIWLGLVGWKLWVFRSCLWLLGALAIVLVVRLLPSRKRVAPGSSEFTEVGGYFQTATRRLQASGVAGKGGLSSLPLVLLLGPGRSAKTSVVQHAGLDADFLAGYGDEGEPPPPTPHLNLWLRLDKVLMEVGEPALKSDEGWGKILDGVRVGAWASMTRGQPARMAVVCVGCEWLKSQGRPAMLSLAKELRGRLAEAAAALDTRLPTYVLFTKADEIPFFAAPWPGSGPT